MLGAGPWGHGSKPAVSLIFDPDGNWAPYPWYGRREQPPCPDSSNPSGGKTVCGNREGASPKDTCDFGWCVRIAVSREKRMLRRSCRFSQGKWYDWTYFGKRGSASLREMRSVREKEIQIEREREREREIRKWRHHCRAKIGVEITLSLAKNSHLAMSLHFPLPKIRTSRFSLHTSHLILLKWSPLWRWNSQWVLTFRCHKISPSLFRLSQVARLFFPSKK